MPRIIMNRAFIARWTRMPHSIGRLSASATSHHSLSSAAFITNIAESDFRHAQVSVADLYAAAFGPGFLLAGLYIVYLMGRAFFNPKLGPPVPVEERVHSLPVMLREIAIGTLPLLGLITATLGSILAGLATPTEAAGVAAGGVFIVLSA